VIILFETLVQISASDRTTKVTGC